MIAPAALSATGTTHDMDTALNDELQALQRAAAATEKEGMLTSAACENTQRIDGWSVEALREAGIGPVNTVDFAELRFFGDGVLMIMKFDDFMQLMLGLREGKACPLKDIRYLWKQSRQKPLEMRETWSHPRCARAVPKTGQSASNS